MHCMAKLKLEVTIDMLREVQASELSAENCACIKCYANLLLVRRDGPCMLFDVYAR